MRVWMNGYWRELVNPNCCLAWLIFVVSASLAITLALILARYVG